MTQRILLLRFDVTLSEILRHCMEEAGFEVECPSDANQGDLSRYQGIVQAGGAKLDLIGAATACPLLTVTDDANLQPLHPILHEVVSSKILPAEFIGKLKRLLYAANVQLQLEHTKSLLFAFEHRFADMALGSLPTLLESACEFYSAHSKSENALWVSHHAVTQKVSEELFTLKNHYHVLKPFFALTSLTAFMEQMKTWLAQGNSELAVTIENQKIKVILVRHPHNQQPVGYFCLLKPQAEIPSWLESQLNRIVAYAHSFEQSQQLAFVDDLTGLYNQRYLPLVLSQQMSRAQRDQKKLSVLFIDVDYFKTVNDQNGHVVGSKVLKQLSELILICVRSYDYAFRYGGDEFVVVLPGTHVLQAQAVAERIRSLVERHPFVVDRTELNLTVSIGIATFPDHALTPEQVLHLADQAMYYGKNVSRNIVYLTG